MFYGNSLLVENSIDDIDKIYKNLCIEQQNFNNLLQSINVLNENEILVEINFSSIKTKIVNIIDGIIKFVSAIIGNIKKLFKKREQVHKVIEKKIDDAVKKAEETDKEVFVKVYKPTFEFVQITEAHYIPELEKIIEKTDQGIDVILKVSKGVTDGVGSKNYLLPNAVRDDVGQIASDMSVKKMFFGSWFNGFGGFNKISTQNEKCFTVYETSDTEEAKKIMDTNHNIAEKCIEVSNKLNDKVMYLRGLKRQFIDTYTLKDDYFYDEFMEYVSETLSNIQEIYNAQKSIITVFETASYPAGTGPIVIK